MYRIDILSDIVLFKLYEKHVTSDEELSLSPKEIAELFREQIPINLLRSAIESSRQANYERDRLIRRKGTKGNYKYDISLEGIAKVQDELRRSSSPIAFYVADANRNLEAVAGIHTDFMTSIDRANAETWMPLPIDRKSVAFNEMESSVVDAIDAIEKDNGFAVHFPEERAGILQTLRDGLDWISSKSPTRAQVRFTLLTPLTWIVTRIRRGVARRSSKKSSRKNRKLARIDGLIVRVRGGRRRPSARIPTFRGSSGAR